MRKFLFVVAISLLSVTAWAQNQAADNKPEKSERDARQVSLVVSEGAIGKLSLRTPLSTKLNEVGDNVDAVLYEDVRADDGRIAIPKGTQFFGKVSQVQRAGKGQKQSSLKITFANMLMPYGAEKVAVTIVAIDDYGNDEKYKSKDGEGKVQGGRSGGRTARNAGMGAGMGSLGGIFGGLAGAAIGAGAGAMAGVLMTKGNDLKLNEGTILRIRFEKQMELPDFEQDRRGVRRIE